MADNFTANAGSGGDTFAADEIAAVKYPRSKIVIGADGVNDGDVSASNPLPVTGTVTTTGTVTANQGGTWNIGTVSAVGGTLTTAGTVTANQGGTWNIGTVSTVGGTVTTTGTLVATQGGTWNIGTLTAVAGTVTTTGTLAATQSGTWNIGTLSAVSGTVTTTGTLAATQSGTWSVNPIPATSGGLSIFRSLDLDETEEEVKATAGQVYGMWVANTGTATRFIKLYNATAANVTVGTTTPVITIPVPGNATDDVGGVFAVGGMGVAFDTAITAAATTGVADNDTGAPGANEVVVNIFFK